MAHASAITSRPVLDRARTPARVPTPVIPGGPTDNAAWAEILGLSRPNTVTVSETSIRGLPALERATGMVVNAVSTMLTAATVTRNDRPIRKPEVIRRPHPLYGSFEFYQQVVRSAIVAGNYVAIRIGDEWDDEHHLVPVPLGSVSVDTSTGLPLYFIEGRVYTWREIFHVRANAPVGTWWGIGVVEKFRTALSEQLYQQAYGEASFRSGSVPSVSVQIDVDTPTTEQVDSAKSGFIEKFGGGAREPIVHGRGLTISPLSWSPHDAEFVESRKLTIGEAALMVGLRPEDIGATLGEASTYGNRSDDSLQRITDGYGPWMQLIEEPLSDLLPVDDEVHGNPEALLRTSTKERYELRQLAQAIGIETPEESRVEEGRTPLQTAAAIEPAPTEDVIDVESEEITS